jgi:hypothetical protein
MDFGARGLASPLDAHGQRANVPDGPPLARTREVDLTPSRGMRPDTTRAWRRRPVTLAERCVAGNRW